MLHSNKNLTWLAAGSLFAILWSSASSATKIGLRFAQPFVISELRFALASLIMLSVSHVGLKERLPVKQEWKQIAVYGLLNITVYLGLYVIAIQKITAGIGALAIAANPVFISFLSVFFLRKKLHYSIIVSLIICSAGVLCASWPLLGDARVSGQGLMVLFLSMVSYSVGSIYFSQKKWNGLSLLTINGWQTLMGGIFLLPLTIIFYKPSTNHFNLSFWLSVIWLAIPVSIFAVQLWMWLLKISPVRAGLWLFLCPLFGFIIAAWLLKDTISIYTIAGVVMVIIGLIISKLEAKK